MDKRQFWQTIENSRKDNGQSDDVFLKHIRNALDEMTASDIIEFQAYLNAYMKVVNFPAMWEAAALINKSCTDDGFEYFRAWLVSQGEHTYHEAFKDPDSLYSHPRLRQDPLTHTAERCEFESFMYQPMDAYKDVTGHHVDGEYYRAAYEMENDIAKDLCREFAIDDCMKIQHKPEDLEMAFPQLAKRCYELGYNPKETCLWPRHIPTVSWSQQM